MMERQIHAYCDKCGAEGPYIVGERRPALNKELVRLGWVITDTGGHICMECERARLNAIKKPLPPVGGPITPASSGQQIKDGINRIIDAGIADRSIHWTEARKKGDVR